MRPGLLWISILFFALAFTPNVHAQTLQIGYPDDSSLNEGPGHFKADYLRSAELVIKASGLTVSWVQMPFRRMIREVKNDRPGFCIGGMTISPERQAIGQFTKPFRIDHMLMLVGLGAQDSVLSQMRSFAELAAETRANFIVIRDLYYGDQMSAKLQRLGDRVSYSANSTDQVYDMLLRRRADFGIVTKGVGGVVMAGRPDRDLFTTIAYPDMRRDAHTAILCSKLVPVVAMEKLNDAIERELPHLRALFPDQAILEPD